MPTEQAKSGEMQRTGAGDTAPPRNNLVLRHYTLVQRIARQIHSRLPQSVELDDLISVGVVGLIESIARYNPTRGVPFDTYARHRIRGAILDALRAVDWVPHSVRRKAQSIEHARRTLRSANGRAPTDKEMAARLGIELDDYRNLVRDSEIRQLLSLDAPAANDNPTPLVEQVASDDDLEVKTGDDELRTLVMAAVSRLPEREATALTLYYFHELPLKAVGEHLGVTESRACQLCGQGVKRLRRKLGHLAA